MQLLCSYPHNQAIQQESKVQMIQNNTSFKYHCFPTQLMTTILHQRIVWQLITKTPVIFHNVFAAAVEEAICRLDSPFGCLLLAHQQRWGRLPTQLSSKDHSRSKHVRSALGIRSILEVAQIFMGKGDICCDIITCFEKASWRYEIIMLDWDWWFDW